MVTPGRTLKGNAMLPHTIKTIIDQTGGRGYTGALAYIGVQNLIFSHPDHSTDTECRPDEQSHIDEDGVPVAEVALTFRPNTKRRTFMTIAYEPDDTYTLYFYTISTRKGERKGKIIKRLEDVYCDMLREVIESTYDEYIKTAQNGFITIR